MRSFSQFVILATMLSSCSDGSNEESGCRETADCKAGEICDGGTCKAAEPVGCVPACADPAPVCDEATRTCRVCTATQGCEGATPYCDPSAGEGAGACLGCRDTADCKAPSICDPNLHRCVGCTESEGCSGAAPICDGGECVACTATAGCEAGTFCDLSVTGGRCVTCTPSAGCDAGQVCDLSVEGGACVTCTPATGCGPGLLCDQSVPGGVCVRCTATAGCEADQVCDSAVPGGACVTCTADHTGCEEPTPVCDTSVAGGRCVGCTRHGDCVVGEFCDEARLQCVVCNDANQGCDSPWPYCDVAGAEGKGACVECLADAHCAAPRPYCDPAQDRCVACLTEEHCGGSTPLCSPSLGSCVECLARADCGEGETCTAGSCVIEVSAQIQAVRDAQASSFYLPIQGALVTYLRDAPNEAPGFFLQGERSGPAIFVCVDPAGLDPAPRPGDRVSLVATAKGADITGIQEIDALTGWTVTSRGNSLAGLVQDVSDAPDLTTAFESYQSELVSIRGRITGAGGVVYGFARLPITTAGMPAGGSLYLRMPLELRDSLGLGAGCDFTLVAGPMWRAGMVHAAPSAYRAADLTGIACP